MSTFPIEPYEASRVDGASKFQTFVYLTLPFCKPALIIILVYQMVLKLRVFDLVYLLSGGGPVDTTTPLGYLIYKYYFRYYDGGLGAATAVIVFICSIIISIVIIKNLHSENS
jgi:multiple sugar transport system permease protein